MQTRFNGTEIAIIAMSGRFPGANNINDFWRLLRNGEEAIRFYSNEELISLGVDPQILKDPSYIKASAILEGVELFDAAFFGMNHREAEITDPQHRLLLECAWEAIEQAGYDSDRYTGAIGVFAGATINTYLLFNLLANPEYLSSLDRLQINIGNASDFLTTRISYKLNLKGPSHTVQSACSTSLTAIHIACQSLLNEECDMALAGGVSINLSLRYGYHYRPGGIVSPDGHCRSFDAKGEGTIFGSGVGIVVLKRLQDALADHDNILAIIKGSAVNNDGSLKVGYTAPGLDGQAQVIAEALANAGVEADTISYVEAHGTATTLGDPIEIAALTKAFRASTDRRCFCAIGSVKTNIGHLDAAAGVAGLIKTVLALKNRELPPSLHYHTPNPQIDFEHSPFYVNTHLNGWPASDLPRRAGVSSFGVGGTNAHIIVEESPVLNIGSSSRASQLLLLSAKSERALKTASTRLAEHLSKEKELDLADAAYTLQTGRKLFSHRQAVVCTNLDTTIAALTSVDRSNVFTAIQEKNDQPVVFMFTGQGSQYVNMCLDLYRNEPVFRQQVDQCAEALKTGLGFDLRSVLYPEDRYYADAARQLDQTAVTQPALFVIEYALAKLWMSWGVVPESMIGHSIGEFVAATLSGVLSIADALSLVCVRGKLIQQMAAGAMLTIPMSEAEIVSRFGESVSIAVVNGPSLCVVSGSLMEIEELQEQLSREGVACRRLKVGHAFHSQMMAPIIDHWVEAVKRVTLGVPKLPYISNVTGSWITEAQAGDANYWGRHLRQTVRFSEGLNELLKDHSRILLEVGPGETLSRLAKRHPAGSKATVVASLEPTASEETDLSQLLRALGKLWLSGASVDWTSFYAGEQRRKIVLPTYPFEKERYWVDAVTAPAKMQPRGTEATDKKDIQEWFYLPIWRTTLPLKTRQAYSSQEQNSYLIFEDEVGLGCEIAQRLRGYGQKVTTVKVGTHINLGRDWTGSIDPSKRDDYQALIQTLLDTDRMPDVIIHLWSLSPNKPVQANGDSFKQAQRDGFYSILFLAQALERTAPKPIRFTVVSNHLLAVTDNEFCCQEKATILGACQVIPQEIPNLTCQCIDVCLPEHISTGLSRLIDRVLAEIDIEKPKQMVAYRGDQRWVNTYEPLVCDNNGTSAIATEGGVYIITGTMDGPILALAHYLAYEKNATLAVVNDLSNRGKSKLQQFEGNSKILCFETGIEAAIRETVRQFGTINGVIYSSGFNEEEFFRLIPEVDERDCHHQFERTIADLYALEKALRNIKLDFCLICSSLSTVLGGLGTVTYSCANHLIDAFARNRNRAGDTCWITVNWDAWQVMDNGSAIHSHKFAIAHKEGLEAIRLVFSLPPLSRLIVSTTDLLARIEQWINPDMVLGLRKDLKRETNPSFHPRPNLPTPYVAPANALETSIYTIWQQALGLEMIGVNDNFFDLGGDSLVAIQVSAQLKQQLKMEIPVVNLYEGLTIRSLAKLIAPELACETASQHISQSQQREERQARRKNYQEKQLAKKRQREV
ncbi:MAG: beta-ketoacyl synthase N-terminal-like domain-containing protein [Acidobacteriota bacterium]